MKRMLKILLPGLIVAVGITWLVLRHYLNSSDVVNQVTSQIADLAGEHASVEAVDIGLTSSTVHGVKFFEPGETQSAWLTVDSVTIDAPIWQLARGNIAESRIQVTGAKMLLRFNSDGDLITHFPPPSDSNSLLLDRLPELVIEQSELTLWKDRHGEITANEIRARVNKANGELVLTGSAESDVGTLDIHGSLNESLLARLSIANRSAAHVQQDLLMRLPFIPVAVFRELQVQNADARAALDVSYNLQDGALHYQATVDATNTDVYLPRGALAVQAGHGKITVEDNIARLQSFSGSALGGTVRAEGKLDYQPTGVQIALSRFEADDLKIEDVPDNWGIPLAVRRSVAGGKLSLKGKLDIIVRDPNALTMAAAALVTSSDLLGRLSLAPMLPGEPLVIESQGKGEVRDPAGKVDPMEFDWQVAPVYVSPTARSSATMSRAAILLVLLETNVDQPKPEAPPKYFEFKFNLKNASLAELVKHEDLKLPFPIDGKMSIQLKASIPLDQPNELKLYKAEGSAQIKQFKIASLNLDEVTTDFHLADGTMYLDTLKSALAEKDAAGTLAGSGRIQIAPLADLHADLRFDKLALHKLIQQKPDVVQGTVSGSLVVDADASKLKSAKDLRVTGEIRGDQVAVYGMALDDVAASLNLKDGIATIPELRTRIEGVLLTPTASLQVTEDGSFLAKLTMRDLDTDVVRKIAAAKKITLPPIAGTLSAEVVARGDAKDIIVSGDIQSSRLKLDAIEASDVHVDWKLGDKRIDVTDVRASLYDGKVNGSATIPTDGKSAISLDASVEDVNVKRLASSLRMPIRVEGKVKGTLKGTITPGAKDEAPKAEFHVDFKSPSMRVQNIPTEQLQGKLEYKQGNLDYLLTGKSLGGTFDLQGEVPRDDKQPAKKAAKTKEGRLRIRDVQVSRLFDALGARSERDLSGTFNLDVRYTHDGVDRFPRGKGTVSLTNMQWSDAVIAENIQGDVILDEQQFRIRNLEGTLARGTMTGQLAYYFRDRERSWFTLNLDSVETAVLLGPWFNKRIEGSIQARVRGKLGRVWSGSIDLGLTRGKASGLEIADLRLPINWSYSFDQGRGEVEIHDATAQLARGNAKGKLKASWENSLRVEGSLRLDRVELSEFLRESIGKTDLVAGTTTARLEIKGSDVRSINDLEGVLVASFEQAQALQLPVLQQISPFLGIGPSTTFQKGNLVARLNRGTARIEQMTLTGANTQVFVAGSINTEARLNLNVVAKTGDVGWPTLRLGPIGLRLPPAGPVPLVLAEEVSALISNQVVYLDVTGTPRSPTIRPRPLPILSAEAVRFFLNRTNLTVSLNP